MIDFILAIGFEKNYLTDKKLLLFYTQCHDLADGQQKTHLCPKKKTAIHLTIGSSIKKSLQNGNEINQFHKKKLFFFNVTFIIFDCIIFPIHFF
jgi:hypothetical protein